MIMRCDPLINFRKAHEGKAGDLAAKFGVDRRTLWRWETGKTPVPIDKLDIIEAETGISRELLRPDVFRHGHNTTQTEAA